MKWILCILMIGLQASAETEMVVAAANPQAEIGVIAPTAYETVTAVPDPSVGDGATVAAAVTPPNAASIKQLKETEIPVNLEASKKGAETGTPIVKFALSFAIIGVLAGAAYFFIRKYRFQNPRSQATQIKVLTQHYLGPKKSLAIVRVAGESVLIGITDHNISMIKSLSLLDEDIPEDSPKEFQSVFAKKTAGASFSDETDSKEKDEFSISGIKDIVSGKLKNMRSLE